MRQEVELSSVRVSDFHFDLPEELIAQHPPADRGSSRMLVVDRPKPGSEEQKIGSGQPRTGSGGAALRDLAFRDLPGLLRKGDLLVLNDSRVLPARLFARRAGLTTQANSPQPSGVVEVLLTEQIGEHGTKEAARQGAGEGQDAAGAGDNLWRVLVKPARKVRVGEMLNFHELDAGGAGGEAPLRAEAMLRAEVVGAGEFGERTLRFVAVKDFYDRIARIGRMPLPPYIRRDQAAGPDSAEDRERYQTVYSGAPGSAAAPTAGLHFTPEILAALAGRGVEIARLTLHVGLGTFQPVRVSELKHIRLHAERYTLPATTAEALNRALREGRRVIAVGTTTTRALEHIGSQVQVGEGAGRVGRIEPHSGSTSIFIAPGYRFRVVKGLLTNFHLPGSTLLMLVAAFASPLDGDADEDRAEQGRRCILDAYAHATRERYRFYSYGDCMLVL
jgi:S-adenosylmethionine:tRNA ribosyltransferase-isomerase